MADTTTKLQETVDAKGKPAKKRFETAFKAKTVWKRYHEDRARDAYYRSKIKAMKDGNPPYSKAKFKARAESWRANVNYREMESVCESNAASLWDLIIEVPQIANFKFQDYQNGQRINRPDWEQEMAREFHDIVTSWKGFYKEVMRFSEEMVTYGRGPVFWRDAFTWQFSTAEESRIVLDPMTSVLAEKQDLIFIQDEFKITELVRRIEKGSGSWKNDQLKRLLMMNYAGQLGETTTGKYHSEERTDYQQKIKSNDFAPLYGDENKIRLIHAFFVEPKTDKISHGIFTEFVQDKNKSNTDGKTHVDDWLYYKESVYDDMSQAFQPMLYSLGDGYYQSVKGLGHKSYNHIELSNSITNDAFNAIKLMSGIIVKMGVDDSLREMRIVKKGPIMGIPSGFEPIQNSFQPNILQLISGRTLLHQILQNNTAQVRPRNEHPDQPEKTAKQVESEDARDAQFQKHHIVFYYLQWGGILNEVFRRLMASTYPSMSPGYDEWKKFRDRLKNLNIPEEFLQTKYWSLKPMKLLGAGSPSLKRMDTRELLQLSSSFPRVGQVNIMRDFIAARGSYDLADRYMPQVNPDEMPNDAKSFQQMENNDMIQGQTCMVGENQDHVNHLKVCLLSLAEIAQVWKQQPQQINVQVMIPYFQLMMEHAAGHLQYAGQNPYLKDQIEPFFKMMDIASDALNEMIREAKRIQQQQQMQMKQRQQELQQQMAQQGDPETRIKLAELEKEYQLKFLDKEMQNQIRRDKADQAMTIKDMMAAQRLRHEEAKQRARGE